MEPGDVDLLVSADGWALLQSLPPYQEQSALGLATRLRDAGFEPRLVAAALAQSRLRAKAVEKFGDFAQSMIFTPDGLEQATRLAVAARHADRFRAAGVTRVLDLGCGIGADSMALAGLGIAVTAIDADPVTAAVAAANLRFFEEVTVRTGLAAEVTIDPADPGQGAWLDPARRRHGPGDARDANGRARRVFGLDELSPSWQFVQQVAATVPATGAKLSPSMPHAALPPGTEAQWLSVGGEVLECAVWWGPLVQTAGRTALVIGNTGTARLTEPDALGSPPPIGSAGDLGPWLYDPDRAVVRAGLVGALSNAVSGSELSLGAGYVTAAEGVDLPWAKRYAVREVMPWNEKAVRTWLRDHGIGNVTIKKRAVSLDPDKVRRELRMTRPAKGANEATLVLTRIAGASHVVICAAG